MPRRVQFVGRDASDPQRPRLMYQTEDGQQFAVPEEMVQSPQGAEQAAAEVGGYTPQATDVGQPVQGVPAVAADMQQRAAFRPTEDPDATALMRLRKRLGLEE